MKSKCQPPLALPAQVDRLAVHAQRLAHGAAQVRQPAARRRAGTAGAALWWGEPDLRPADCGILWEHLVLEHLLSDPAEPRVMYWRDKDQHEVDFVIPADRKNVNTIECKWDASRFDPKNLQAIRAIYPAGKNFVVAPNVPQAHTREVGGLVITYTGLNALAV